jgi:hypothetical protein
VIGQVFLKMELEPINKLKQTIGAVAHAYLVHAPILYNPDVASQQKTATADQLRILSGQLHADISLVPGYKVFGRMFFLPTEAKIYEAAQSLIAIGNWMYSNNSSKLDHIIKNWQRAADNLHLYMSPGDRVPDDLLNESIRNSMVGGR